MRVQHTKRVYLYYIIAAVLPFLLYGFRYFPILDDFIQYGSYPKYQDLSYVYVTIGTLSTRPLASLLDPLFWGMFWNHMWVSFVLISALYIASGILFSETLKEIKGSFSPFFLLVYFLFPMGAEGRIWLSAATRLIPGLFFASLSFYFLVKYIKEKKARLFLLFAFFQLISCGFYESVSVFSCTGAIFISLFYKRDKKSSILISVTSVLNLFIMFFYYKLFASLGALGSRAGHTEWSTVFAKIPEFVEQLGELCVVTWRSIVPGFINGISVLFSHSVWGVFLFLLLLTTSILLGFSTSKMMQKTKERKKQIWLIVVGICFFFIPLAPNFLAETMWLTNRSLFVSFIGLGLFLEGVLWNFPKKLNCFLLCLLCFLSLFALVNEYDVYKRVSEQDITLVKQVSQKLTPEAKNGEKYVQVVLKNPIETPQNAYYKDHVKSVFGADWSLSGALRAETGCLKIVCKTPVLEGEPTDSEDLIIVVDSR